MAVCEISVPHAQSERRNTLYKRGYRRGLGFFFSPHGKSDFEPSTPDPKWACAGPPLASMKVAPSSLTRCSLAVITVCLETQRSSLILVVDRQRASARNACCIHSQKHLFPQKVHTLLYAFLSAKKAFTPSHRARFCLIYNGFECEGLDFQVFTSTVAFYRVYLLIFG